MFYPFRPLPLVPDRKAEVPSQIYLDASLSVPLKFEGFPSVSDRNAQRALLNLPLPTLTREGFFIEETSSDEVNFSVPAAETTGTYIMNNKRYEIPTQYFGNAHHFSTTIHKDNIGDPAVFYERFVRPFLLKYNSFYLNWVQETLGLSNQRMKITLNNEVELYVLLSKFLYDVIQSPLLHSLELHRGALLGAVDEFIEDKGGDVSKTSSTENTEGVGAGLMGFGNGRTRNMGIHCRCDLLIGLMPRIGPSIAATAIGEVKLPTLMLRGYYGIVTQKRVNQQTEINEIKKIKKITGANGKSVKFFRIRFHKDTGFAITNSPKINEVQGTIRKLITTACYLGVNRVMLTTYTDTILIHIDPDLVKLGEPNFKADANFGDKPLVYVKSVHYHLQSNDPMIRLKILSFFETNEDSLLELKLFQTKVGAYFKKKTEESRAFETVNAKSPSTGGSVRSIRSLVNNFSNFGLSKVQKSAAKKGNEKHQSRLSSTSSGKKHTTLSTFASSIFKSPSTKPADGYNENEPTIISNHAPDQAEYEQTKREPLVKMTGSQLKKPLSSPKISRFHNETVTLDEEYFNRCQLLELGNLRIKFLQTGDYHPQVMLVNSKELVSHLSLESISMIPTEDDLILKVFDPYWAHSSELSKERLTIAYQDSIDMFTNEFNLYKALAPLCGSVIPQYYGAFTVDDCTVSVGKPYIRVFGPSIMIQNLENMRHPNFKEADVDDEFITQKIIPQYEKLHALGVSLGGFEWEDILVTKDYTVKVINFRYHSINATTDEMEEEKNSIYNYFGPQLSDSDESSWD